MRKDLLVRCDFRSPGLLPRLLPWTNPHPPPQRD